jgi:hypothetical protein
MTGRRGLRMTGGWRLARTDKGRAARTRSDDLINQATTKSGGTEDDTRFNTKEQKLPTVS